MIIIVIVLNTCGSAIPDNFSFLKGFGEKGCVGGAVDQLIIVLRVLKHLEKSQ